MLLVGSRIKSAREPVFCRNGWTDRAAAFDLSQSVFSGIFCRVSPKFAIARTVLRPSGTLSKTLDCGQNVAMAGRSSQRVVNLSATHTHIHTHPFSGPLSRTTWVSRYQKGKTNLDFTEARVSEWQWHQLGHMQVCTSLQTDNHTSTPPLSFLQAGCPSCRPTNSVIALKAL